MFENIILNVTIDEYGEKTIPMYYDKDKKEYAIDEENGYVKGKIKVSEYNGSYIFTADVECNPYPYGYFRAFKAENALTLKVSLTDKKYKGLIIEKQNPFWTWPQFLSSEEDDSYTRIQHMLLDMDGKYYHFMPISSADGVNEISYENKEIKIYTNIYYGGSVKINIVIAVISICDNPYDAVSKSYRTASENKFIITPLKLEKKYPKELEGLGWCTWNAFYHDVTADGIEKKLAEFKDKQIPVKWIVIDDGWAMTEDFKLKSGLVDRNKFPDGLKATVTHIKQEYDVEYVGIWHSFTGYWFGIDKNGELYNKDEQLFEENNSGLVLPGKTFEQAYKFYSDWHKYLKDEGIDFLKVDCQGNALEFYKNTKDVCEAVVNLHNALEKSVLENFGGVMINCMGTGSLDMFSRNSSSVVRNSDDFFPNKEDGFESHIIQNAYNAIFNDNLFICDFDMWWTKHTSAKQSSVLRAISGGPVYVSDEVGNTNKEYLIPIIDANGKIIRCDNAAKPTADCIFQNPYNGVLKLFNAVGENIVIAIFNLSDTKKSTAINLKDIYATGKYYMYRYFEKSCGDFEDGMVLEIEANDVQIIKLHKTDLSYVDKDKYIC